MKTIIELEQIGIMSIFKDNDKLCIITKDYDVWVYSTTNKQFYRSHSLI